jgi:excisionase family DNA binding protein
MRRNKPRVIPESRRRQLKTWFTPKDIAGQCMVSKITVTRWIKTGKLLAVRLPSSHYRINPVDYNAFLERYHIQIGGGPFQPKSK